MSYPAPIGESCTKRDAEKDRDNEGIKQVAAGLRPVGNKTRSPPPILVADTKRTGLYHQQRFLLREYSIIAFSSEVEFGSREESVSNQKVRVSSPIYVKR